MKKKKKKKYEYLKVKVSDEKTVRLKRYKNASLTPTEVNGDVVGRAVVGKAEVQ